MDIYSTYNYYIVSNWAVPTVGFSRQLLSTYFLKNIRIFRKTKCKIVKSSSFYIGDDYFLLNPHGSSCLPILEIDRVLILILDFILIYDIIQQI